MNSAACTPRTTLHPARASRTTAWLGKTLTAGLITVGSAFPLGLLNASVDIADVPLIVGSGATPPLTMLIMGRDHTLFYEAYNDASDLNGDGVLNIRYEPDKVEYFGYFDSNLCYTYSTADRRFNPSAAATDKKCTNAWSGDFLNYITTARIDALRKVLYGGARVIDTKELTVLERAYIPQDAHSWGKEYHSIAVDGYDIRHYTPLPLPQTGTRHLFANTTLLKDNTMDPLMRVLTDSQFRIWEWVARERPVAGTICATNSTCERAAGTLTYNSFPTNADQYQSLINTWATPDNLCGSGPISGGVINTTGSNNNPFTAPAHCGHDHYLTIIHGTYRVDNAGEHEFATNGDDAVELRVNGNPVSWWYGGHGRKSESSASDRRDSIHNESTGFAGSVWLEPGWHPIEFRHQERDGGDNWQLLAKRPGGNWHDVPQADLRGPEGTSGTAPIITTWTTTRSVPASVMTDYRVQVKVCDKDIPQSSCKQYPSGHYKPVGLLQDFGENDRMLFGLLTGSYTHPHNMRGGVLRKNIESIKDEIDPDTGQFNSAADLIRTIDRLRIVDFNSSENYQYNGGWLTNQPMSSSNRQFPDWGNPIGEMMYEGLRYFSGKTSPTPDFKPPVTKIGDKEFERITLRHHSGTSTMDLPVASWQDPFDTERAGSRALWCSPAAKLVISDVNPSYDTHYLPGSHFSTFAGDIPGLNVVTEADAIWLAEYGGGSRKHFIGESGSVSDGIPNAKTVSSLGTIRGLSPAEPTKQGGYYSASIARYGFNNDIRPDMQGMQNIHTFSVALASPLPRIEIPVGNRRVTVVPFGKSVGQGSTSWAANAFQPTNTIVDFFIETFANTDPKGSDQDLSVNNGRPYIVFRINFEDVEQGADHDMDAIVRYELKVNANDTLTITLDSEYAAGGIIHHMGYVISGTTQDGVYLEVRDKATSEANDVWFPMSTPPGKLPGDCAANPRPTECDPPLPLWATRTFTAGTTTAATLLNDPLWYAAKYGSRSQTPLNPGDPSPNYFLVTNASTLQSQLTEAFKRIMELGDTSTTTAAVSSAVLQEETLVYSAGFRPEDWSGQLRAFSIQPGGTVDKIEWDAEVLLAARAPESRKLFTMSKTAWNTVGTPKVFGYDHLSDEQKAALDHDPSETLDNLGVARISWLKGTDSAHASFRSRVNDGHLRLLGDIVKGDPHYLGKRDKGFSYFSGTEGNAYTAFVTSEAYKERPDTLFVSTNAGFIHAFDAKTGVELFAYMPSELLLPEAGKKFAAASRLMQDDYKDNHRFFVDGSSITEDVYIKIDGNDEWRTILIGTMGAGGRTVFALDVTNPAEFSAANVLWEFTHDNLGYGVTHPQIARLSSGKWVAIFGNGYNSLGQQSGLFIVDIADGSLISYLPTGIGSAGAPNGLAPVAVSDWGALDLNARYVYAGDLLGNLWRFDIHHVDKTAWSVKKLFTAIDPSDNPQPITAPPQLAMNPDNNKELMVLFGTGSYFRISDTTSNQIQSLYGIADTEAGTVIADRSELLQQEITWSQGDHEGTSSNNRDPLLHKGWYLDLAFKAEGKGERVISKAAFAPGPKRERIIFSSMQPDSDPCSGGVTGRYTDLMIGSGKPHTESVFDINGDGSVNADDMINEQVVNRLKGGSGEAQIIIRQPGSAGTPVGFIIPGGIRVGDELKRVRGTGRDAGRQSWRQLR